MWPLLLCEIGVAAPRAALAQPHSYTHARCPLRVSVAVLQFVCSLVGSTTMQHVLARLAADATRTLALAAAICAPLLQPLLLRRLAGRHAAQASLLMRPATSAHLSRALLDLNCGKALLALAVASVAGWAHGAWAWQLLQVATVVVGAAGLYVEGLWSQRSFSWELGSLVPSPTPGPGRSGGSWANSASAGRQALAAAAAQSVAATNSTSLAKSPPPQPPLLPPLQLHQRGELVSRSAAAAAAAAAAAGAVPAVAALVVSDCTMPSSPSAGSPASCAGSLAGSGSACPSALNFSAAGSGSGPGPAAVFNLNGCSSSSAARGSGGVACSAGSGLVAVAAAAAARSSCCVPAAAGGICGCLSAGLAPWSQLLLWLALLTAGLWLALMAAPLALLGGDPEDTYLGWLEEGPAAGVVLPLLLGTCGALLMTLLCAGRCAARGELQLRLRTDREEGRRLQVFGWAGGLALAVALLSGISWSLGEERNVAAFTLAEGIRCLAIWPAVALMEPWLLAGVGSVGGCDGHVGCGVTCHVLRWLRVRRTGTRASTQGGGRPAYHALPLEPLGPGLGRQLGFADVEAPGGGGAGVGSKQQHMRARPAPVLVN